MGETNLSSPSAIMFRQEQRVWISRPILRDPCLSELEASLLAMEQQNKEMASLKHDLVRNSFGTSIAQISNLHWIIPINLK